METDFYYYVNKDWMNNNSIPDDKSRWSQFEILAESNYFKIKYLLESEKKTNISILYNQNFTETKFLNKYIEKIDSINNLFDLFRLSIQYSMIFNVNYILNFFVFSNYNDANKLILHIYSGLLGLPSKEYYLDQDKEKIRNYYIQFINDYSKTFNIDLDAKQILEFEKVLAKEIYNSTDARTIKLINNPSNFENIQKDYPNISFIVDYFFKVINKNKEEININNPKYLNHINNLLTNIKLDVWKLYLKYKLILAVGYMMEDTSRNIYLTFYENNLLGSIKLPPIWKQKLNIINNHLGQDLSELYIKNFYNDEVNQKMMIMTNCIIYSIKKSIINNSWLNIDTKRKALIKIKKMNLKIGHPKKEGLYDYSKLILNKETLIENVSLCIIYNNQLIYNELYKPINKERWSMPSYSVNAYYSNAHNEIVFPAGILQEPFFYKDNMIKSFAGIGYIIGHEIIHAFDNKGRQFDENGNLKNWWTEKDNKIYENLSNKLVEQYSKYQVNGKLTLGENIADLGGVKFALLGLETYFKINEIQMTKKHYQYFFISYAKILAANIRENKAKNLLLIDPHSPNKYRVNGVIKNIQKFYEVFDLKNNDEIINIW
jgi:putative endopeptidase